MSTLKTGKVKTTTIADELDTESTAVTNVINGSAKAWVNFNGTGAVAIRESFNVNSITDVAVGRYEVNFTNAFSDINYVCVTGLNLNTSGGGTSNYNRMCVSNPATTSKAYYNTFTTGSSLADVTVNQLAVFR